MCLGRSNFRQIQKLLLHLQVSFTGINLSERAGAEQVQADTNVAAASSGEFAGIKVSERAGAEHVQAVDHRCENLHDKEVQVGQSLCLTSFRLCWRVWINVCNKVNCLN